MTRSRLPIQMIPLLVAVAVTAPLQAQQAPAWESVLGDDLLAGYQWRNLGPDRGGRSSAVSGVVGQPEVAYFGAVGGGLWKTTDGGDNWFPVTDFQINSASVGAVAVSCRAGSWDTRIGSPLRPSRSR